MTSNKPCYGYLGSEQPQPTFLVAAVGFGVVIEEKLKALFQQERLGKPVYKWVAPTEANINIVLLNYDNPSALQQKHSFGATAAVVAFSQGPLLNAPIYHVRGMLTAARVLTVLDKVPAPAPQKMPLPPAKLELVPVVSKPAATVISTPVVSSPASQPLRYRALVVDDSVAVQKSLELKLSTLEQIAAVDFAENGEAALAMAASSQYDLIFLDVMMPGMDGYEACTQLRKNPAYKKTPIIMVSGKTSPMDEVKGIMAGCTTYLTKPVQEEAFQKLSLRVLAWLTARNA